MFGRIYKYSFLQCVRDRYVFFWCLLFPIILGTLFKVSFGDVNEKEMTFHQISVAYLEGEGARMEFKELLTQLEKEEKLVKIIEVKDEQEAKKLLKEEEITGIYKNDTEISLMVKEESASKLYPLLVKWKMNRKKKWPGVNKSAPKAYTSSLFIHLI